MLALPIYIRAPFFLEGMMIVNWALISVVILYLAYGTVVNYALSSVPFMPLITDKTLLYQIFGYLLLGGTFLGAMGSMIAVRKYLNV